MTEKIQEEPPTTNNSFTLLENQPENPTSGVDMENIDHIPLPQDPSKQNPPERNNAEPGNHPPPLVPFDNRSYPMINLFIYPLEMLAGVRQKKTLMKI